MEFPDVQFNATGRDLRHILALLPTRRDWMALRSTCRQLWYQEADDVIEQRLFGSRRNVKLWLAIARNPQSPMLQQAIDYLYDGGASLFYLNTRVWSEAARCNNHTLLARLVEGFQTRAPFNLDNDGDQGLEVVRIAAGVAWGYGNYDDAYMMINAMGGGHHYVAYNCLWESVKQGSYAGASRALRDFEQWLDSQDIENAVSNAIMFGHAQLAKRLYEPLRGSVYPFFDENLSTKPFKRWLRLAFGNGNNDSLIWICDEFGGEQGEIDVDYMLRMVIASHPNLRALRYIIGRYKPDIKQHVWPIASYWCQSPFSHWGSPLLHARRHAVFRYVCRLMKE